jgi:hypothetical protein
MIRYPTGNYAETEELLHCNAIRNEALLGKVHYATTVSCYLRQEDSAGNTML